MLLLIFVGASLLVLVLRGGSVRDLAGLRFRFAPAILGSCLLQLGVMYVLPLEQPWVAARGPLLLLAYGVLLFALVANGRVAWMPLVAVGAALNFAVMAANGGQMPVAPETLVQARMTHLAPGLAPGTPLAGNKDVVLPRDRTALWPLSDIFIWPRLPRHAVFSPGDVLIAVGAAMAIQAVRNSSGSYSRSSTSVGAPVSKA